MQIIMCLIFYQAKIIELTDKSSSSIDSIFTFANSKERALYEMVLEYTYFYTATQDFAGFLKLIKSAATNGNSDQTQKEFVDNIKSIIEDSIVKDFAISGSTDLDEDVYTVYDSDLADQCLILNFYDINTILESLATRIYQYDFADYRINKSVNLILQVYATFLYQILLSRIKDENVSDQNTNSFMSKMKGSKMPKYIDLFTKASQVNPVNVYDYMFSELFNAKLNIKTIKRTISSIVEEGDCVIVNYPLMDVVFDICTNVLNMPYSYHVDRYAIYSSLSNLENICNVKGIARYVKDVIGANLIFCFRNVSMYEFFFIISRKDQDTEEAFEEWYDDIFLFDEILSELVAYKDRTIPYD